MSSSKCDFYGVIDSPEGLSDFNRSDEMCQGWIIVNALRGEID